jgi:hypothetical protein
MTWRLFRRPSAIRRADRRRVLPFPRLGSEMLEDRVVPTTTRFAVGVLENSAAHVRLYDATGVQVADVDVSALAGRGQPSFATADVTGDGTDDLIVGSGVGVASKVQVYDGVTFAAGFSASPFDGFTGGVNVAAGDLTGDGTADIAVTPNVGGGARVVGYRGGDFTQVLNFFAIDSNFLGGARVAIGDVNHDGHPDLIAAAGLGGGPRVAIYDGTTVLSGSPTKLLNDFFAFDSTLPTGVNVAAGDVDGDGFADLVFGAGAGGGPRVIVVSGQSLVASGAVVATGSPLASFFSGDTTLRSGVQVATADLSGDGQADVITGGYLGAGGGLTAYSGAGLLDGTLSTVFNLTSALTAGTNLPGLVAPSPPPPVSPPPPAASGSLITLNLNPLDINLLGVEIQTSPITVTVSDETGDGKLLGNVLDLASHLVNLPEVSDALNTVLGNVVTLLNSASLAVSGVGSGTFDTAAPATTSVLDAFVAPVHLNLLGALVDTSPIHLTITAHSGPGLILGNAVTALANLFNPPLPDQLDVAAINTLLSNLIDELNAQIPGIPATFSPPPPIADGSDRILQLVVAPINLNLLGLNLQTSQINVNADAHTGNGLLLGNVLTTLLNTLDATPDQLTQLSNNINTLLAKVVGVLNAASLTLSSGALGTLDQIIQDLALPTLVTPTTPASVDILNLIIASTDGTSPPVDVNLLGLQITTSNIQATLKATTGDGQILGNLLYNVANLLNPGGSLNLLGILGELGL